MQDEIILYDYWRSSASYRVRIALESLGLAYRRKSIDLLAGQQRSPEHRARNPQGLVPALSIDGHTLTQSLAIIEYLAETRPEARFLPADPLGRQRVRTLSYAIAMEIHAVCNTGVIGHVMTLTGGGEETRVDWMKKFIGEGLLAVEKLLDAPATGAFCHGDTLTMADFCLVPQVYNAERWGVDLSGLERVRRIAETCRALPAFQAAHPDAVKPA
ncbi:MULTISPECIES: maleylacetoacetate isomerase [unclassified Shinella]|uniref:maleylacetoacetate isomerase n=1 Tax=unclassified Shinella TaxID=2643062 RepID=UPI00225CA8C2|nr:MULTISPECIES: maleylacetoacetate isomerase [unclassified Shinella]MCO5138218.1 maleylacetoacetate isomerase [Shinella sp.]MDC7258335.1 maleylacetoacetate isomerase [Shinella sp. YE25]CAI0335652.1 Maleylacetoacetate isomerase [Rhizobiaceae bacterium]CAK7259955.1 Maleylacetoacetate isomerase [Shinella sp. WSC3-e]